MLIRWLEQSVPSWISVDENARPSIPPPPVIGKSVEVEIGVRVGPIAITVPVAKLAISVMESAGVENRAVESMGVDVIGGVCE